MLKILDQRSAEIMKAKNHDYRGGTGDPFANFRRSIIIGVQPEQGIFLRMLDKHQRIRTYISKGVLKVKGESVADAILDCFNYVILAHGMRKEATNYEALMAYRSTLMCEARSIYIDEELTATSVLDTVEESMKKRIFDPAVLLCRYAQLGKILEVE